MSLIAKGQRRVNDPIVFRNVPIGFFRSVAPIYQRGGLPTYRPTSGLWSILVVVQVNGQSLQRLPYGDVP